MLHHKRKKIKLLGRGRIPLNRKTSTFINLDLALLTLWLVLINTPYFRPSFVPVVDTLNGFQAFHFFYSEFYYHGHIAGWLPYGTYGLPSYFLFVMKTIVEYFFIVIGTLFRIQDVLALFKTAMLFEQLFFLAGLYLVCRRLFVHRSSAFLVCIASSGSIVWYSQFFFGLRIFYLFPFVLYGLIVFLSSGRPEYLWLAGIVAVGWAVGNLYTVSLWLLIFTVIILISFWPCRKAWKNLFSPTWTNAACFLLFIALAGIYIYFQLHALQDIEYDNPFRDPVTKKTTLEGFLHYGGNPRPLELLWLFIFGWPLDLFTSGPYGTSSPMDNTVYLGLLPIPFLIWALLKVRNLFFWGLACTGAALILLSFGGSFAKIIFHFPMMAYYRHIGFVYGFVRILLILCAGFGWDHFQSDGAKRKGLLISGLLIGLMALAFFLLNSKENIFGSYPKILGRIDSNWNRWFPLFWIRIALYALAGLIPLSIHAVFKTHLKMNRATLIQITLLTALLFDMASFQNLVWQEASKIFTKDMRPFQEGMRVHKMAYQEQRQTSPHEERQRQAVDLTRYLELHGGGGIHSPIAYNFIQFDPIIPEYHNYWRAPKFMKFQNTRIKNPVQMTKDVAYHRVLGWESPKLRLLPYAVYPSSEEEAWATLGNLPALHRILVLKQKEGLPPPVTIRKEDSLIYGGIRVTDFNANQLTAEVEVTYPEGAWLVYADTYHRGWHATVDGKAAPIEAAYLVLKSVWLAPGQHTVEFKFWHGLMSVGAYTIAIFGVLLSFSIFMTFLLVLFPILQPFLKSLALKLKISCHLHFL